MPLRTLSKLYLNVPHNFSIITNFSAETLDFDKGHINTEGFRL